MRRFLITVSFGIAFMIAGCSGDAAGPTDVGSPSLVIANSDCDLVIAIYQNRIGRMQDVVQQLQERLTLDPENEGLQDALAGAEDRRLALAFEADQAIADACGTGPPL